MENENDAGKEKTAIFTEQAKIEKEADGADLQPKKLKDSVLFYAILFVVMAVIMIIFIPKLIPHSQETLDSLFQKNLEGKLGPEKGYMYNGVYSFVFYDGLWYTQLKTPSNTKLFNIPFHYSPRDLENISPVGYLNTSSFDDFENFFITFDPIDENLNYIGVAVGETDAVLINVFGKGVIPACTRNETAACQAQPIVECNASTEFPVIYFASENSTNLLYMNKCIVVAGNREGLLKAADRMLYSMLGIMKD